MHRPSQSTAPGPSVHPIRTRAPISHAPPITRQPSAYHLSRGRPHPIVRIPNQLMLKILAAANPVPGSGFASWSPYWVPLMAVCRHWRDLIRDTPEFWQKIAVGRSPLWLELCLQRSQSLLILLSFRYSVVVKRTLKALRPHWHRIEYLAFKELDCAQFAGANACLTPPPMPQLHTFIVTVRHGHHGGRYEDRRHDGTGVHLMLPHGVLPGLKTVRLEGMSLSADPVPLSTLREISLSEYDGSQAMYTTAQFLACLGSCVSLERLHLGYRALHAVVPSPRTDRDMSPIAQLPPRLRDMSVHGSTEDIANLLSHVHVPAHVNLSLLTHEWTQEGAAAAVVNMLPAGRLRRNLGILQSATRLKLDSCHGEIGVIKVTATRPLGTIGRLEMGVSVLSGKDLNGSQARRMYYKGLVRAVSDMFPEARLDTLVCAGDLDAITESEWRDNLLGHYPTLRTLVIDDAEFGGDAVPIFKALGATVAQLQLGAISPVCPTLEYLWIRNAEPTARLMDETRRCLSRRQDHRAAPLRRLRLELNPDYESGRPVLDTSGYLPLLKRFVPRCELRVWRRDVDDEEMFAGTSEEIPF